MTKRTRKTRSLAAQKGWRTRRAKARARSLAAKKGWATRRAKIAVTRKPAPTWEDIVAKARKEFPKEKQFILDYASKDSVHKGPRTSRRKPLQREWRHIGKGKERKIKADFIIPYYDESEDAWFDYILEIEY
jgi:hypothetical protein